MGGALASNALLDCRSPSAVSGLKLKVGDHAYAVIKASSVMIAVD
jgi:molybdopterin-binding protein